MRYHGRMETSPAESKEAPHFRRLQDPGTFEAIAQIEGPAWVQKQEELAQGHLAGGNYEGSFQQALDRAAKGKATTIIGLLFKWLVARDGTIKFVAQQAKMGDQETQELLERVRALGFDVHPSP